jgi:hypothetical protein
MINLSIINVIKRLLNRLCSRILEMSQSTLHRIKIINVGFGGN